MKVLFANDAESPLKSDEVLVNGMKWKKADLTKNLGLMREKLRTEPPEEPGQLAFEKQWVRAAEAALGQR